MDPEVQEKIAFYFTLFSPFAIWFAGKFIYNKWEKRKLEAQIDLDENVAKQKEADLLVIYEGMVRRASEDVITKSDRLRKMEEEWNERFSKLEEIIENEKKEIVLLRCENEKLKIEVEELQKNKIKSDKENKNLKDRVLILERALKEHNWPIPNGEE